MPHSQVNWFRWTSWTRLAAPKGKAPAPLEGRFLHPLENEKKGMKLISKESFLLAPFSFLQSQSYKTPDKEKRRERLNHRVHQLKMIQPCAVPHVS